MADSASPPEKALFVVVLTGASGQAFYAPRAVGPFENWDAAQAACTDLISKWQTERAAEIPQATVVHVEPPLTGVVVGEI